jgi:8-oxo-dGTP pyrophosphatase MutT (NUDIX family)
MERQQMKIKEYKQNLPEKLKPRTLCFFIKENKILLGFKKRGYGSNRYAGIGGKFEEGNDINIEAALIREAQEEVNVTPTNYSHVATLNFYFPYVETPFKWNQKVFVYLCTKWSGEPEESEEMKPEFFDIENIPFEKMWVDNKLWLPQVLSGKILFGEYLFKTESEIEDQNILYLSTPEELEKYS